MSRQKRPQARMIYDLFGDPIEGPKADPSTPQVLPLEFRDHQIRVVMVQGEPWFVASDVCRFLGIVSVASAIRTVPDRWKGMRQIYTLGGKQEMLVLSEAGLYRVIMRSDKPEAVDFQDWVCGEVLPSIRRTGTYSVQAPGRVSRMARRLRCDRETAKVRCDQVDINKASHSRLCSDKATPRDYQEWHNGCYRGQFDGRTAADLRRTLGLKGAWNSPLDHMDRIALSANCHAKVVADRKIREEAEAGRPLPLAAQATLVERIAREVAEADLAKLGPGYRYGVVDGGRRGKIIDVVRPPLADGRPAR